MDGEHALLWVGVRFYPTPIDFVSEAGVLGISKRISCLPRWFRVGQTTVYLAHPRTFTRNETIEKKDEATGKMQVETMPGIFLAWTPRYIERLFWESERGTEEIKRWEKRGVKPVFVPDGDKDHVGSVYDTSKENTTNDIAFQSPA